MNKQTIITILPVLVAVAGQGQVKCHVVGTVAEGTTSVELRIYRDGEDPKNSTLRSVVKNGRFECDVEDAQFFSEDGATITIRLDGDKFDIQSSGKEYQAWHAMEQASEEKFMSAYETLDDNDEQKMAELENEYHQWTLDYYKAHPMLGFLFELDGRLKGFHFNDTGLAAMLDIYHRQYSTLYPEHPVHQRIAEQEAVGYQICGRKYNDYDVRTMDGQQVCASEYYKGKLTLVVCWASWCAPCIRDACDIIPIYNEYRNRGLNVFSIAHEFKSTDAMRKAVERHAFPWPCFVDLKHGTQNSALFLIDRDGTIIAVPNSVEELETKLKEIFPDNK